MIGFRQVVGAIKNLNSGEILLVAGKGHEENQDYGSYIRKFSDKKIILKFIKKKNKNTDIKKGTDQQAENTGKDRENEAGCLVHPTPLSSILR